MIENEDLYNELTEIKASVQEIEKQLKTTHGLLQVNSCELSDIKDYVYDIMMRYERQHPTEEERKRIEMLDKALKVDNTEDSQK